MTSLQIVLAILSGGLVGFSLGLLGGGGSILAVPLLLYVVGIRDPHVVIGSTALAVAVNALINLIPHARQKHVLWKAAIAFAIPGAVGAYIGSEIGKHVPDKQILFLFALLMIVMAVRMSWPKKGAREEMATALQEASGQTQIRVFRVVFTGFVVGAVSGFFGIGGGFLIVPGLMFSTGMPMIAAIGSSLLSVGTFGLTTAVNYSLSGLVNWWVVLEYVIGGIVGGVFGTLLATRLSNHRKALQYIFSGVVFVVAIYMLVLNAQALHL
ncbi:MAG: sulfite exporter TauE/SafE family protein [Firmicutes bacterium]|nr:sulfite exporter TauE/SafE family protein [Bacillota bacterium]